MTPTQRAEIRAKAEEARSRANDLITWAESFDPASHRQHGWLTEAALALREAADALDAAEARHRELVTLLADKSYLSTLADYCVRGHKSHYGWLKSKDGGLIDEILDLASPTQAGDGRNKAGGEVMRLTETQKRRLQEVADYRQGVDGPFPGIGFWKSSQTDKRLLERGFIERFDHRAGGGLTVYLCRITEAGRATLTAEKAGGERD